VFDEDPIETILPIRQVSDRDVYHLRSHLTQWIDTEGSDDDITGLVVDVARWCDDLLKLEADDEAHTLIPVALHADYLRFRLEKVISEAKIKSNVMVAIEATFVVVLIEDGLRVFHTISRRSLPLNQNIVILSATVDQWLYQRLFGAHLKRFYDDGLVEPLGTVVQYHSRSFRRSGMAHCAGVD
jgi:hypothetical protein